MGPSRCVRTAGWWGVCGVMLLAVGALGVGACTSEEPGDVDAPSVAPAMEAEPAQAGADDGTADASSSSARLLAPVVVALEPDGATVEVRWEQPPGGRAVVLYDVDVWGQRRVTVPGNARAATVATPDGPYSVTVTARDGAGQRAASAAWPVTPVITRVLVGAGEFTVSWEQAAGGSPVFAYEVQAGALPVQVVGRPRREATLALPPRPFAVTVTARDADGRRARSASWEVGAATPPGPPREVWIAEGYQSLGVSWWEPRGEDGDAPITGYTVSLNEGERVVELPCGPDGCQTGVVLDGLTNETTYRVAVAAVNRLGPGVADADADGTPLRGTPSVHLPRVETGLSPVTLPDGRVLLTGSRVVDVFDPVRETFAPVATLPGPFGTVSVLDDQRVVGTLPGEAAAGEPGQVVVLDVVRGEFTIVGEIPLTSGESGWSATLLRDGRLWVAGGGTTPEERGDQMVSPDTYLFDLSGQRTAGPSLLHARRRQSATLLPDGRVLVVGGDGTEYVGAYGFRTLDDAEVFDPARAAMQAVGPVRGGVYYHYALSHPRGVLVLPDAWGSGPGVNLFDSDVDAFRELPAAWWDLIAEEFAAALLPDGVLLVINSLAGTVVRHVDPDTGERIAGGDLQVARYRPRLHVLDDGRVLVLGSCFGRLGATCPAEIYDPAMGASRVVGVED